jgi:hypothetical protein
MAAQEDSLLSPITAAADRSESTTLLDVLLCTNVEFSYCYAPSCTGMYQYVPVCTNLPDPVQGYRIPDVRVKLQSSS